MSDTTRVPYRGLITASAMLAMLMQTLDSTIANVALPYMQGSMSASADEITWVLTSYVIAAAIMTAPVGWMARRFGRKKLFIGCLAGFTVASMMCGAAQTLEQLVLFRLLQGMCGAAIAPLSQATMLDIYPFSRRAQAMAIFSMGVTMGPIMGPTLGGYLTDAYSWRYVFYVNLPFGILCDHRAGAVHAERAAAAAPEVQLVWLRHAGDGLRRAAADAGPRPGTGLVLLTRDHRRGGAGRPRLLPVHRAHVHGRQAVPVAWPVQRPELRRRHGRWCSACRR